MSSQNKALWFGVAASALVGGAVLFHLLQSKAGSSASAVLEDIDAIGPVKKEANGMLSFSYFKDLMGTVQRHSKERFGDEKKDMLARRRVLLAQNKTDEYKELVSEMIKKEESVFQDIMMEVFDHIGLSEQEFMMVNEFYMRNPQTSQIIMQGQLMPTTQDGPPKITREKAKEIFLYSEEKKMQSMEAMMKSGRFNQMGMGGGDPMEGMIEMVVEQSKLSDEIFEKYGVDDDEFNYAMMKHGLMQDPEIQRVLMSNMQKMGMGGGPM